MKISTDWYNEIDMAFDISTAEQLAGLAELVNKGIDFTGKTINLSADIDLSDYGKDWNEGKGWIPIGSMADREDIYDYDNYELGCNGFKGIFNGNGKIISGLHISSGILIYAGLFGLIEGGRVENLGVVDVNISADDQTGGIAGFVKNGSVEGCYSTGKILGFGNVGGVVGQGEGCEIKKCYFVGRVDGWDCVGGVAGSVCSGIIDTCYSAGIVSGEDNCVGGIAGSICNDVEDYLIEASLSNCAALNSEVEILYSDMIGRVAKKPTCENILKNNVAFNNMLCSGGRAFSSKNMHDNVDGADISAADIIADGTIGGRFTSENGWVIENGKLPGFGASVELPGYIRVS